MDRAEVLHLLDEVVELPAGSLKGTESVKDWDSIAVISLIALADERFSKILSVQQIQEANTVDDVVALLVEA